MTTKNRILAFLLVFALLATGLPVLTYAADPSDGEVTAPADAGDEGQDGGEDGEAAFEGTVLYNRNYEEGWQYNNGLYTSSAMSKDHRVYIDYETSRENGYNYFVRMELQGATNGYVEYQFGSNSPSDGLAVVSFDIMIDRESHMGTSAVVTRGPAVGGTASYNVAGIVNNQLQLWGSEYDAQSDTWIHSPRTACTMDGSWYHLDLLYNLDITPGHPNKTLTVFLEGEKFSELVLDPTLSGLEMVRFNVPAGRPESAYGSSWCFDNLQIYTGSPITDIPEDNKGLSVNINAIKTVEILSGSSGTAVVDYLKDALFLKTGVHTMLLRDEKRNIFDGTYGAPVEADGTLYLPLDAILTYVGYPYYVHPDGLSYDISTGESATYIAVGRNSATVDGKRVALHAAPCYITQGEKTYLAISMEDVESLFPGQYITYDDMGLVIISGKADLIDRESGLDTMLVYMKKFIFGDLTAEGIHAAVQEHTDGFRHPYIYADAATFDALSDIYYESETSADYQKNAQLRSYLEQFVDRAQTYYNQHAAEEGGAYAGLALEAINKYENSGNMGYDPDGGRMREAEGFGGKIMMLGFAYQITRDLKYAACAYDLTVSLGKWEHWGPGHFLNCAGTTSSVATGFDWCYNGYVELGLDVEKIAEIIYSHGVYQAYLSSKGICLYPRKQGVSCYYNKMNNNWNPVCTSGVVVGALTLLEFEAYRDMSAAQIANDLFYMFKNGLDEYAPDGSYVESPGYWNYGTNHLFELSAALNSAAGRDWGIMTCWGIEQTCYFALQTESADYAMWNYHDCSPGQQDTSLFNYVATRLGDYNLMSLRMSQLAGGKAPDIFDVLYWDEDYNGVGVQLPLDYYMVGIDGFVARDGWERGALYTGIMGGENHVSHGQVDSGNFVYFNGGIQWFTDLGCDEYNVYKYFTDSYRYKYYRNNAEGQNVVLVTSQQATVPYGQDLYGKSTITGTYSNEYGSYAWLDTKGVYGKLTDFARRGILLTNDRKTVVIQDEISFVGINSLYWIAHTAQQIELSSDGKTAYLTGTGKDGVKVLRASLVSPSSQFRFEVIDCDTFLLDTTYRPGASEALGGLAEYSRAGYKRLAIRGDGVLSFQVAVVLETVSSREDSTPVGYSWTEMKNWEPVQQTSGSAAENRQPVRKTDINVYPYVAKAFIDNNTALTARLPEFYEALGKMKRLMEVFDFEELDDTMVESYRVYKQCLQFYNDYRAEQNPVILKTVMLSMLVIGM